MRYILTDTHKFIDLKNSLKDRFFFSTTKQKEYLKSVYGINVLYNCDVLNEYSIMSLVCDSTHSDRGCSFSLRNIVPEHRETPVSGVFHYISEGYYGLHLRECNEDNGCNDILVSDRILTDYIEEIYIKQPELFNESACLIKKVDGEFKLVDNEFTKLDLKRPEILIKPYAYKSVSLPEMQIPGYEIEEVIYGDVGESGSSNSYFKASGSVAGYKGLLKGAMAGSCSASGQSSSCFTSDKTIFVKYKRVE